MIWCGAREGNYSVKLGYEFLEGREEIPSRFWDLFWCKDCLLKVGAFAWLAVKGRILTRERRKRLGFMGPSKCVMCSKSEELVDHLLLRCEVATRCWSELQEKLNWQGPLQSTLKVVFESWPRQPCKSTLSILLHIIPSLVIWEIWKECNRSIFQDNVEDVRRLLNVINRAIEEVVGVAASQSITLTSPFTSMDSKI